MLKDKVVVITGGSGLIGSQFVQAVLEQGAIAIIADINLESAKELEQKLANRFSPVNIDAYLLDITEKDSISRLIDSLDQKYARVDAVVNNAYPRNKNYGRHFNDVQYTDFCENLGLNLGGYFLVAQQFSRYFENQGFGNIINISSIYGVVAPRFEIYDETRMTTPVEYAVIKSGLLHLTKYMAKYFKGKNIRVNSISPGGILDGQPESFLEAYRKQCLSKGMLDSNDLNGSLVYLLSDMSKYVNGQNLIVDDGFVL